MIEGSEKVTIGDRDLYLAPLNFKAVQKYGSFMNEMQKAGAIFDINRDLPVIREIMLASLRRNEPSFDEEWFDDNLDTRNMAKLFQAILKASVPPSEPSVGELTPAANGQSPTGKDSTSTS